MAVLEVTDSWSSWKISREMDQLQYTWRASLPAMKLEPLPPLAVRWSAEGLGGGQGKIQMCRDPGDFLNT